MKQHTTHQQLQGITRRTFLHGVTALTGATLLAACTAANTATVPATQQPTALPTTEGTVSVTTTVTAEAPATSSAAQAVTAQIVAAANAFLATLGETERTAVTFPYPSDQTTATAANFGGRYGEQFGDAVWSNYPVSDVIRPGLRMGDLAADQREAVLALLATTLSAQGYQKVLNIMQSDQLLSEGGTNYASGADSYVLGLFGTPSESERWMVEFGGHHLGLNVTIQGAAMTMAPTLTGCQPASYTLDDQIVRPLGGETDKAFTLINALDADQQAEAILSYTVSDLVLGPGHDGQVLQPEGIAAATMNADQQALLLSLVGEWVNILNDAAARPRMAAIEADLAETYFAWSGPIAPDNPIYFRITGPTLHIEFANQGSAGGPGGGPGGGAPGGPGGMLTDTMSSTISSTLGGPSGMFTGTIGGGPSGGPGGGQQNPLETGGINHIHAIYRDPTNEYGTGLSA
ncbi:MAG: DUF3500 domain-containing protein [Caldilineaceae bacterium]